MEPTTTRTEIRLELLDQHAYLRTLIDRTRQAAIHGSKSPAARDELQDCLRWLAEAARVHNEREETLLRGIIPTVDAWGAVRVEIMDEVHLREHHELSAALIEASALADEDGSAAALLRCLDQMLAHMVQEEKTFLNEKVLNDDFAPVDAFGG